MATIQTCLQFNVRKKRWNSSKLQTGKENADYENKQSLATSTSVQLGRKFPENKHRSEGPISGSCLSTDDSSDSDSDIDCIIIKQRGCKAGRRKSQRTKIFEGVNYIDESADDVENTSSPPKRGKTITEEYDGEVKNDTSSPRTPSRLITRLHLNTPSSGTKRGKTITEEYDDEVKNGTSSPRTPSHLITRLRLNTPSSGTVSCKNKTEEHLPPKRLFATESTCQVHQALQSCAPTNLPGREEHLDKIRAFLQDHLTDGSSGALYVSGPPGTGKTASLLKTMDLPEFKCGYKIISANCTSMKSSGSIYARISKELGLKVPKQTEKNYLASIERHLSSNHKMILLVLDEIDQLDSRKQSVLYTIFEWPSIPNSKLVLVGIANALDLTDRILPRLQARVDLKPQLLHFAPYSKLEIVDILTERLKQSGVSSMFPPVALQLLAGKVASTSGDVRRALDIGRRVIELAEAQKSNEPMPLQPTTDHAANTSSPRKSLGKNPDSGSVALKEVMTVLNCVYGTSRTLDMDSDESFPLQQKVLVSTLLLMLKRGHNKDITLGKLHEVYCRVCKKKNILAVGQEEFLSLCQLVETKGMLKVQGRKETRLSRVCLQWDEEEVCAALKDKQLLASILGDASCLS